MGQSGQIRSFTLFARPQEQVGWVRENRDVAVESLPFNDIHILPDQRKRLRSPEASRNNSVAKLFLANQHEPGLRCLVTAFVETYVDWAG